jgi:hypothetical protein
MYGLRSTVCAPWVTGDAAARTVRKRGGGKKGGGKAAGKRKERVVAEAVAAVESHRLRMLNMRWTAARASTRVRSHCLRTLGTCECDPGCVGSCCAQWNGSASCVLACRLMTPPLRSHTDSRRLLTS